MDIGSETLKMIAETRQDAAASAKAMIAVDFAVITLLIDAGLTTAEEAALRIEQILDELLTDPGRDRAKRQLQPLLLALQNKPAPSSRSSERWSPVLLDGGRNEDD